MTPFAEFHGELRAVARDLLGTGPAGAPAWDDLAAAGWCGLEVPEALEGAGATFAETAVVIEELGRAAAATPYLGAVVLGVGALTLAEPGPERDALLAATAAGEALPVLALPGDTDPAGAPESALRRAPGAGGSVVVDGRASAVLDAPVATFLLLPVAGDDGRPALAVVRPDADGVSVAPVPLLDATRTLADVTARSALIDPEHVLGFAADPDRALTLLHDRAALAVALDGLGLMTAMLDATVAYAKVRQQFGRAIGSFQAVKHRCADLAVQLAVGRALADAAVDALVAAGTGEDAALVADVGTAVAMAKAHVGAAAVEVVGAALQLHGGIGYTWESGVHVYLKRASLDRSLFGSPAAHRRRLARRYGASSAA